MNKSNQKTLLSVLVNSALIAMSANVMATEDPAVAALTQPKNAAQVSVIVINGATPKFGEYSGLIDSLPKETANLQYQFGSGFDAEGAGNARFSIDAQLNNFHANRIGLTASESSSWFAKLNHDEMRHYVNEGYQTPLNDLVGNKYTLPANFGIVNTTATAGKATSGTNGLTVAQQNAFRKVDVYTGRVNDGVEVGGEFEFAGEQLNATASINRLTQSGGRLIAAPSETIDANGVAVAKNTAGNSIKAEAVMLLINPTDYRSDSYLSSIGWRGKQGHVTASYNASVFQNMHQSLSWENPFVSTGTTGAQTPNFITNTLGTAPNNANHQFGLQGGYDFNDDIKLAGSFSRGVNTQTDELVRRSMQVGAIGNLPFSSLNGLVVNAHADSKLTAKINKSLKLTAGARYDLRDNQTQVGAFYFQDIATNSTNTLIGTQNRMALNAPLSTKKVVYDISADYKLNAWHSFKAGYEYEIQDRWCNNASVNNVVFTQVTGQGLITPGLLVAGNCVSQPHSTDGRANLAWRGTFSDFSAGLAVSQAKRVTVETDSYYNPLMTGLKGENYDWLGFNTAYNASRIENSVRANASWQPNEDWNISTNARYAKTAYDLTLGVKNTNALAFNLEALYTFGNGKSVSAYYTRTTSARSMTLGVLGTVTTAPTQTFTTDLSNRDDVIGMSGQYRLNSKLSFAGDASLALASSVYQTSIDGANTTCNATNNTGCGVLPDVNNRTVTLKLSGTYKLTKDGTLTGTILHQQMKVADYFYNGYQFGYTPTSVLPTYETAPGYKINMLAVAYGHSF